ncbi:unnamed protein product, partial [Prunus brigantina]
MPKSEVAQDARGECKIKSKSTGTSSSRRWSIKDFWKGMHSYVGLVVLQEDTHLKIRFCPSISRNNTQTLTDGPSWYKIKSLR